MNAILLYAILAIAPSPPPQPTAPQQPTAKQEADRPDTDERRREELAKIERARTQREQDDTASK